MKKNKDIHLINKDSVVQVDIKSWSEILLFLNDRGWKPSGLLTSFLGDREVNDLEAKKIEVAGQKVLEQALKEPISIYPVSFDMGKFAEIICFCEEGSFRISVHKE
jgi:hypothetical protein